VILTNQLEQAMSQSETELVEFIKKSIDAYQSSKEYLKMLECQSYIEQTHTHDIKKNVTIPSEDGTRTITIKPKIIKYSDFASRFAKQLINRHWTIPIKTVHEDVLDPNHTAQGAEMAMWVMKHGECHALQVQRKMTVFKATEFLKVLDPRTAQMTHGIRFYKMPVPDAPLIIELYDNRGYTQWFVDEVYGGVTEGVFTPYLRNNRVNSRGETIEELSDVTEYTKLPIATLKGSRMLTRSLKADIDTFDHEDTMWHDEFQRTHNVYWTFEGHSGNVDDLLETQAVIDALRISRVESDNLGKTGARIETVEFPFEAHRESLNRLENDMHKKAEVTNISAITIGNVTATAIEMAFEAEVNKVGELIRHGIEFYKDLLEISGVENPEPVEFSIKLLRDESALMKILAEAYNIEVPAEILWRKIPFLSQAEVEEAENMRKSMFLGMGAPPTNETEDDVRRRIEDTQQ